MKYIHKITTIVDDVLDRIIVQHKIRMEIKHFKDPRREKIYSAICLSDEQKKSIDSYFIKHYGSKIPYIWHKHYTAFTGNFDVKYFPEHLFIPVFEWYMNNNKYYDKVLQDKNFIPNIAASIGLRMPHTIISNTYGILRDGNNNIVNKDEAIRIMEKEKTCFCKPSVDSGSGKGCVKINICNGQIDNISLSNYLDKLGSNFVIQEAVACHESISSIYPNSVNTFRVISYIWNDAIYTCPVIMRIGQGGAEIDNAHVGGMFIAVDNDGTLHKTAFTEFKDEYTIHPNTDIQFEGYRIQNFEKVLTAARKMHEAVPQVGIVNWDLTIGCNGEPILIEANIDNGSIWMAQMAHGHGVFEDNTGSILEWCAKMNKVKKSKRGMHLYGK